MPTPAERLRELVPLDREARVGRTTIQAGASAALITCLEYVAAFFDADLDPWDAGTQAHFPPVFTAALFTLGAVVVAWWMNRAKD